MFYFYENAIKKNLRIMGMEICHRYFYLSRVRNQQFNDASVQDRCVKEYKSHSNFEI